MVPAERTVGAAWQEPPIPGVQAWVQANCLPAWSTYTGKYFETDQILDLGYYLPTADAWEHGDRGITCYVDRLDRGSLTSSLKLAN